MTLTASDREVIADDTSTTDVVLAHQAEKTLVHRIILGVAIATPLFIGLWVGLVALAVHDTSSMGGPIAMAVGIGVLNGVFFGTWAGFVVTNETIDEVDELADATSDVAQER